MEEIAAVVVRANGAGVDVDSRPLVDDIRNAAVDEFEIRDGVDDGVGVTIRGAVVVVVITAAAVETYTEEEAVDGAMVGSTVGYSSWR